VCQWEEQRAGIGNVRTWAGNACQWNREQPLGMCEPEREKCVNGRNREQPLGMWEPAER
jgi:hypothetical protein